MPTVEAPKIYELWMDHNSLFLAGGITDCPNWQQQMIQRLESDDFILFNPRRQNFPIHDPTAHAEQVRWEHEYLRRAWAILFWFPCETLCPIVLYELGAWSLTDKPLYIGIHPEYRRRSDVEIQTQLVRPEIEMVYSLDDLAEQVETAISN